jgi:hypothetical protein
LEEGQRELRAQKKKKKHEAVWRTAVEKWAAWVTSETAATSVTATRHPQGWRQKTGDAASQLRLQPLSQPP